MNLASLKALGAIVAATVPWVASAQLSANVGLTTNYKFRGHDQDASHHRAVKPALQGGFDYAFGDSGWYVGNWNSSVDWLPGNSLEMDFYGGYRFNAGGVDLDVGALTYAYPGNSAGNTTELYGAATYGPFTARYSHTVSRDYFGWAGAGASGRNTGYLNLAFAYEVLPRTTFKAALGYTRFAGGIRSQGVPDYVDYSLGASYDFGDGLALGAAVAGATKKGFFGDGNKARLIVNLTKTF